MAVGDRYRITCAQTYLSQGVINVYHYKQYEGVGGSAEDLRSPFVEFILPEIRAFQSNQLSYVAFTTINLDNLDDFDVHIPVPTITGVDTTVNPLASFYAFSYQFVRSTRASRHGWKRIAGIPEEAVVGNSVAGGYSTMATDAAAAMFNSIIGVSGSYRPVIVRKNVVPALSQDFAVQDVVFRGVSTQNTRKAGRGT